MIALLGLSAFAAGCSGGSAGPNGIPKTSSTNPLSTGKLEFAVGTANIYGTVTGLNVVSTYRGANGLSNVLLDTPTIKGPFVLPAAAPDPENTVGPYASFDPYTTLPDGPSAQEVAVGGEITGTSANVHIGTPICDGTSPCTESNANGGTTTIPPNTTTFGQSGGVFVNGISPGNSTQSGTASSYVPYTEPLYDNNSSGNVFVPFGGPPAFPGDSNGLGLRDGLFNLGSGVLGIPLGITTFEGVAPSAGSYTLSLQVPTGNNNGTESYGTVTAAATLSSATPLGAATVPTFVEDGVGGGTFTVSALPAGATEEIIQVVDFGLADGSTNCQGTVGASPTLPVYYTIEATSAGTYTLPDTIGPNSNTTGGENKITPSPSLCTASQNNTSASSTTETGDLYSIQTIAADYPLYESLYPNSKSETPSLVGANGQADISISALTPSAASGYAVIRRAIKTYQEGQMRGNLRLPEARTRRF